MDMWHAINDALPNQTIDNAIVDVCETAAVSALYAPQSNDKASLIGDR